jgi:hypothetical protein
MSELSVSERRIKPIHDAIDCEKWQKKGEKSDHFQVRASCGVAAA